MLAIKRLLFACFLLLSLTIHANDDLIDPGGYCGGDYFKNALVAFKLSPSIQNNGQLMAELMMNYGAELVDDILKKHPALKNPTGPLDARTISWMVDSYFAGNYDTLQRFFIVPFQTDANRYGAEMAIRVMLGETFPDFSTRPVFLNQAQFHAVKEFYEADDFRNAIHFLQGFYGVDEETARSMAISFHNRLYVENAHFVGLSDLETSGSRLVIYGHGLPGGSDIADGGVLVSYKEVVELLKANKISKNTDIELGNCFGGCGKLPPVKGTEEQLKQAFLNGAMDQYTGSLQESYAYRFARELYSRDPDYTGKVIAYKGSVSAAPTMVWTRDPRNPSVLKKLHKFGVSLQDSNGKMVTFDKDGMRIELTREQVMSNLEYQ